MSVASRTRSSMGSLTAGERKVARALLADYPRAGLGSAADLAGAAGVSAPTVVRFARSLGFAGYSDLSVALVGELGERTSSPATKFAARRSSGDVLRTVIGQIEKLGDIPAAEIDAAVGLLADPKARIACFGGRFSGYLAGYLGLHLEQMRPGVRTLTTVSASEQIDAGRRDVFVVYDFRRYQTSTIAHAERLAETGARIICITDPWLSPIARFSTVVLPTSIESSSPFDTAAPGFVLTELLIGAVLERIGEPALDRMQRWDRVRLADVEP